MITPNQFEAEQLIGDQISVEADVLNALKKLHQMGPKIVVMSSTNIHSGEGKICLYASK